MNSNKSSTTGIGFTGLLQVAFVVLKLCSVIQWKWVWVLAPTWISLAIALIVLIALLTAAVIKSR